MMEMERWRAGEKGRGGEDAKGWIKMKAKTGAVEWEIKTKHS